MTPNKQIMITKIEYEMAHTEWDTSYKVVRIGDVLQRIKDNDESYYDIQEIQKAIKLFDLWRNYWYTINEQSIECIEFIYSLIQ